MNYSLIESSDLRWNEVISTTPHDFYQTAEYHRFESDNGEGRSFLFVFREEGKVFAWPYLLRPAAVPGVGEDDRHKEVSSCYGYGSPVYTNCENDKTFLSRAFAKLIEIWHSQGAVCAFTRLHPVLETQ